MTAAIAGGPSRRDRIIVALAIGLLCSCASLWVALRLPLGHYQDFAFNWKAAQITLHGGNPYTAVRGVTGVPFFLYPLPLALAVAPLAAVPVSIAGAIFVGVPCALIAYATND